MSETKLILVITNRTDYTADLVITRLIERGLPYIRFNTEDFPFYAKSSFTTAKSSLILEKAVREVDFSDVKSVWYRRPEGPSFPADFNRDSSDFVTRESREFLQGIWRCLDCVWVNHPDKIRLAENKIEQLRRMTAMGLKIPNTLITNDPESARDFCKSNSNNVVAKTLRASHGTINEEDYVIYTNLMGPESVQLLDTVRYSPVIFQERIEKVSDVRVTVVGPEVFATEIHSQGNDSAKIDWRRETLALQHTAIDLPSQVKKNCMQLVTSYGLIFGALDLIRTRSEYVFLELNPNGQWAWIESLTGQPISNKLADVLAS